MLPEATIAMFVLMGMTWAAAIWASFQAAGKTQKPGWVLNIPTRRSA
jgi:hypothetical protein